MYDLVCETWDLRLDLKPSCLSASNANILTLDSNSYGCYVSCVQAPLPHEVGAYSTMGYVSVKQDLQYLLGRGIVSMCSARVPLLVRNFYG